MTTIKGVNMTTVKYQNRSLILNTLRASGASSRVDIAQRLGLTPAAITILVNEMVSEGIISEVGQMEADSKKLGRKKTLIDINFDFKHVIGISIEPDWIGIGISNLQGVIKSSKRLPTNKAEDPVKLLKSIGSECMNMLWKENILKDNVLGIGVGIVGQVDRVNGISNRAFGLWNKGIPIKEILEEAIGIGVEVDNNVRALALGELEHYRSETPMNILFIKYGPGIGSAMVINNEIYYGNSNSAGEIGHTIVDSNGESCKCGRIGCLETVASEKSVIKSITSVFSRQQTPILFEICAGSKENITIEKVYNALEQGDGEILTVIRKAVNQIAFAIANTISVFDPGKVILYGKAFSHSSIIKEFTSILKDVLGLQDIENYISLSKLNHKESYTGGVAIALKEFFYDIGGA